MPKVVASIEARMSSSRLPGKVLAPINGTPALTRLVRRLQACASLDGIVLATTVNAADDPIVAWADREGVACYRGSEEDVLNRVVEAQRFMGSEIVVEICGDCPLLDPEIIDQAVDTFLGNQCDVVTNTRTWAYPQGVSAQVFPLSALEWVDREINDPAVREHVSLYFYEHPELYRIINLMPLRRQHAPELRFQLDYEEDLRFLDAVYRELEPVHGAVFGVDAVLDLLSRRPELKAINASCQEKAARPAAV